MPTYTVQFPSGESYDVNSDTDLSEDQAYQYAASQLPEDHPSFLGAAAREAGRSALPAWAAHLAGGGAYAAATALAPETGGLSYAIPIGASALAGIGAFMGARKLQDVGSEAVAPESFLGQKSQQQDVEAQPMGTMLGGFAAMGRPSLTGILKSGDAILTSEGRAAMQKAVQAIKTVGPEAAAKELPHEMELLGHVANVATNAAIGGGQGIMEGQSPQDIGLNVAGGALFNKGWLHSSSPMDNAYKAKKAMESAPDPLVDLGHQTADSLRQSGLDAAADALEQSTQNLQEKKPEPIKENATPEGIIPENNLEEHIRADEGAAIPENAPEVREAESTETSGSDSVLPSQEEVTPPPVEQAVEEPQITNEPTTAEPGDGSPVAADSDVATQPSTNQEKNETNLSNQSGDMPETLQASGKASIPERILANPVQEIIDRKVSELRRERQAQFPPEIQQRIADYARGDTKKAVGFSDVQKNVANAVKSEFVKRKFAEHPEEPVKATEPPKMRPLTPAEEFNQQRRKNESEARKAKKAPVEEVGNVATPLSSVKGKRNLSENPRPQDKWALQQLGATSSEWRTVEWSPEKPEQPRGTGWRVVPRESLLEEESSPTRLGKETSLEVPLPSEPRGTLPQERSFPSKVKAAASKVGPEGKLGSSSKVLINHLYDAYKTAHPKDFANIDEFKKALIDANKKGTIGLSRLDLVSLTSPKNVKESETKYMGEEFHLIRPDSIKEENSVKEGSTGNPIDPISKLNYDFGRSKTPIKVKEATPNLSSQQESTLRNLFEKAFQRKIVFFEPEKGSVSPNGLVHAPLPDTIFLNAHGKLDPVSTAGHELVHSIKLTHPEVYRQMAEVVKPLIREEKSYADQLNSSRREAGLADLPLDEIPEEIIGDFVGERILKVPFLKKLEKADPALFQKIATILREWIAKVKRALKTTRGGTFINDLETAENAVVEMMREIAGSKESVSGDSGEAKFSVGEPTGLRDKSESDHRKAWSEAARKLFGIRVHPSEIPALDRFLRISDMPESLRDLATVGEVSHSLSREKDMAGNEILDTISTPLETPSPFDLHQSFRNKLRENIQKRNEAIARIKDKTHGLYSDAEIIQAATKLPRLADIDSEDRWIDSKNAMRSAKFSVGEPPDREVDSPIHPEAFAAINEMQKELRDQHFWEPLPETATKADKETETRAKAILDRNPNAGEALAKRVMEDPHTQVNDDQQLMFAMHGADLDRQMERDWNLTKDPEATPMEKAEALSRWQQNSAKMADFHEANKSIGTENARALRIRRATIAKDNSISGLTRKMFMSKAGEPLTEADHKYVAELHAKLKDHEDRLASTQKKLAEATLESLKQEHGELEDQDWWQKAKSAMTPERFQTAEAFENNLRRQNEIRALLNAAEPQDSGAKFSIASPEEIRESLKGKSREELKAELEGLEKESDKLLASLERGGNEAVKKAAVKARDFKAKKGQPVDIAKVEKSMESLKGKTLDKVPHSLLEEIAKYHIQKGVKTTEELSGKIAETLKAIGDFTPEEVNAALSKYGQVRFPSKEVTAAKLREHKGVMRLLSQLGDILKGKYPSKTGYQRDKSTARQRELTKDITRKLKELGIQPPEGDKTVLASRRQAIVSRLQNEIEELTRVIEGKATPKGEIEPPEYDAEMKALKKERDELSAYVKDLTGPSSEHEWNERAQKAADRLSKLYDDRIEALKRGEKPQGPKPTPEATAATQKAKETASAKREEFKKLRDHLFPEIMKEKDIAHYQKVLDRRSADYERRIRDIDAGTYAKPEKKIRELTQAQGEEKLKGDRLRQEFVNKLGALEKANRSKFQKILDAGVGYRTAGILSNPAIPGKLGGAVFSRIGSTAIEDIIGGAIKKVSPKLAARAPTEGHGFNPQTFAKNVRVGWKRGNKAMVDIIRSGSSDLDVQHQKAAREAGVFTLPGRAHGAIKAYAKEFAFDHAFDQLTEHYQSQGVDVTNSIVADKIASEAYQAASRAIFMQKNAFASLFNRAVEGLEQKGHNVSAAALKALFPVFKVPTNIVAESAQYVTGLPIGLVKAVKAYRAGIDTLKPEEADLIVRQLKKGSLGSAMMLLGFFAASSVGGYYNPDEKRKAGDVKAGGARIFGVDIPTWLMHAPPFEAMHFGATMRRSLGSGGSLSNAALASGLGMAEHAPFVNEVFRLHDLRNAKSRAQFMNEFAKASLEPAALQKLAEWTDRSRPLEPSDLLTGEGTNKRAPEGLGETLKTGIPGLREQVGKKIPKPLEGTQIVLPEGDFSAPRKSDLLKKNPTMTNDQFEGYAEKRNAEIKKRLEPVLYRIRSMSKDKAHDEVERISRESTRLAKAAYRLQ